MKQRLQPHARQSRGKDNFFLAWTLNNDHWATIINFQFKSLAVLLAAFPLAAISQEATLETVVVTAPKNADSPAGTAKPDKTGLGVTAICNQR